MILVPILISGKTTRLAKVGRAEAPMTTAKYLANGGVWLATREPQGHSYVLSQCQEATRMQVNLLAPVVA